MTNIQYPLLIDGGLSNVLESQEGCDLNNELWVAKLIATNEQAIVNTHLAYLNAGARVISTSSYQASVPGFMAIGYTKPEAEALILKSVELANEAKKQYLSNNTHNNEIYIAASLGPYGAYLADGSEYRGNYGVSNENLHNFHTNRIDLLDSSAADFFAIETVPSYEEAKVIADILMHTKKQAWVSFSCKDAKHINDGTPIEQCAELFSKHPNVFAVGINCTAPKYVSSLIQAMKEKVGEKKIAVYPNSGEAYNANSKSWIGIADPALYLEMVKEWHMLGADILGGCCRIGPEHIRMMKDFLNTQ